MASTDISMAREYDEKTPDYVAGLPPASLATNGRIPPPQAVVALPPCWPTYSAAEWLDLNQKLAAILLISSATLLVTQAILIDGTSTLRLTRSEAYRVQTGASFAAFFLLSIGLVSATSSMLLWQSLRLRPTFESLRHKPAPEIVRAIYGWPEGPSIDLYAKRNLVGARRLSGLANFSLGSGAISLAVSIGARMCDRATVGVVAPVLVIFGFFAVVFFVFHGLATWTTTRPCPRECGSPDV